MLYTLITYDLLFILAYVFCIAYQQSRAMSPIETDPEIPFLLRVALLAFFVLIAAVIVFEVTPRDNEEVWAYSEINQKGNSTC
jgi:hypothetical protein